MPPSSESSSDEATDSVHRFSGDRPEAATEKWARSLEIIVHVLLAAERRMLKVMPSVLLRRCADTDDGA